MLRERCSSLPAWLAHHDMFVSPEATLFVAIMSVILMLVGSHDELW